MRFAITLSLVQLGCPAPYRRGDLAEGVALDCIDVVVRAEHKAPATGIVLDWKLGNRCERAVSVDLSVVRVFGVGHDSSTTIELRPYDPHHEIVAKWLPARDLVHEEIAYVPAIDAAQLIVEPSALESAAPSSRRLMVPIAGGLTP